MNRVGIIKNDRGATLVMVIVAMLFVGIIAAIAMTITVGNSKGTRTTIETSENFYSSENILNDLEMYLKKLATDSATNAYAQVVNEIGTKQESLVESDFQALFATEVQNKLGVAFSTATPDADAYYVLPLSMLQSICLDRYGLISDQSSYSDPNTIPIKIKYEKIDTDENGRVVLKNVVISLKEDGLESTITTDIVFNARLPKTGQLDSSSIFDYDIDHFLLISGRDIKANGYNSAPIFSRGAMSGTYTGDIYAYRDMILQPKREAGKSVNLRSNYIITGNNLVVDKGTDGSGTLPDNGIVTIGPINRNSIVSKPNENYGTNIWTDNFKIYDGSVTLNGVGDDLTVNTYLGGNLELNGNKSEFILNEGKGELIGYSYNSVSNGMISSTFAPKSSAIILNGLGAKLDLSKLTSLQLSGTAYTAISDLQNVENLYSSYGDTSANLTYYTQGESITYRALQALYLVPGNCIDKIGHNPMTINDVLAATGKTSLSELNLYSIDVTVPPDLRDYINTDDKFRAQYVRYAGTGSVKGEDIIYLFWNFSSKAKAVEYFNKIRSYDDPEGYFSGLGLADKQIKMLTDKSGYIKLPPVPSDEDSSIYSIYGNAVYYDNGLKLINGNKTVVSAGYDTNFGSLKSGASISRTDNGNSLIVNMFPSNRLNSTAGGEQHTWDLLGPLQSRHDKEGKSLTFEISKSTQYKNSVGNLLSDQISYEGDTEYATTKTYKLVTGENINMSGFNPDYTYIVITPGNVTFTTAPAKFRGMIIAGGDISVPENMDMECLGMLSYDKTIVEDSVTEHFDTTEFRALLEVCIYNDAHEEDPSTGNFKLRQIFNVADTSATAGSGNGDDFVTIQTNDWKRN